MAVVHILVCALLGASVPDGAAEGSFVEVDGHIYQVENGALVGAMGLQAEADPVVVTASRVAEAAQNVRTITREDLTDRTGRTLADVLQQEAGVQVNSSVGLGSEVFMDGMDGRHVLILVDGRPLAGRVNNRVDVSRIMISPANIERIEVVRGPMSAIHGSEAMGGVINIITVRPETGAHASVEALGAATPQGASQASLSVAADGVWRAWSSRISLGGLRNWAQDRGGPAERMTPDGVPDAPERRAMNGDAELIWLPHERWSAHIHATARGQDSEARFGAAIPFRDANSTLQATAGAVLRGEPWDGHAVTVDVRADRFQHRFFKQPMGGGMNVAAFCEDPGSVVMRPWDTRCPVPSATRTLSTQTEARAEARHEGEFPSVLGGESLARSAVGGVLLMEHAERVDGSGANTLRGPGQRFTASVFGELFILPWPWLTVSPGLRLDGFSPATSGFPAGGAVNPKLTVRLDLPWGFFLRTAYGEGFRLPSPQERFLNFDHSELGYVVHGNANLTPEKSRGARMEVAWQWPGRAELGAEAFANLLDGLITETGGQDTTGAGVPIFTYGNLARAMTAGINLRMSIQAIPGVSVDVYHQWLPLAVDASKCNTPFPYVCTAGQGARALPLRAQHSSQVRARVRLPRIHTTLVGQAQFTDERPVSATITAPAYALISAGLRQPVGDAAEVWVTADNVLDRFHPVFGPKPGRALLVGVRARL